MKKPAIRAIFVDFGNVCATFDFRRFIENFSRATKVPQKEIEVVLLEKRARGSAYGGYGGYSPLFELFECGELPPVQFFHVLTALLGCRKCIDYFTFARLWTDIFDKENEGLDELLALLPQKKYLLSNTNKIVHGRHIAYCRITRNHFPLREQRILSCEVGAIKPNPLIYKVALRRAEVKPEQALFLDDMPENIEAWRALGGVGIVYHAGVHSIQELRKELLDRHTTLRQPVVER